MTLLLKVVCAFSYTFFINVSEETYLSCIKRFTHIYKCGVCICVVCMLSCLGMYVYMQVLIEAEVDARCLH